MLLSAKSENSFFCSNFFLLTYIYNKKKKKMDKDHTAISSLNHNVTMSDRKNIVITGVKKIDSFDNEEFLMDTSMGYLVVKGEELELIKLDTVSGNVSIKGLVHSITYVEETKKDKENSIFNRLFK